MNYFDIMLLLVFVSFIAYIPIGLYIDIRKDRRELIEAKAKDKLWLEEQLKMSKYRVKVFTKNENNFTTPDFEPSTDDPWRSLSGFQHSNRHTSLDKAHAFMDNVIRYGAYYDKKLSLMIPVCEIEFMKATNE